MMNAIAFHTRSGRIGGCPCLMRVPITSILNGAHASETAGALDLNERAIGKETLLR
jgi:hypothetical protein